jgi:two-component system OmpR family response regulator
LSPVDQEFAPRGGPQRRIDVLVVAPFDADVDGIVRALAARRLRAESAATPEGVAKLTVGGRPDVIVVDLRDDDDNLADRLLSWVTRDAIASAIVITAVDQVDARLRALQLGAADHIVSPFEARELAARVELQIARRRAGRESKIEAGDITIDLSQRCAIRDGEIVALTPRELALLVALAQRRGETVSKQDLLCTVWRGEDRSENVVESNVSSLRRKLHGLGPPVIHTVHRSGYIFRPVSPSLSVARATLVAERDRMVRERDTIIARRDEIIRQLTTGRGETAD